MVSDQQSQRKARVGHDGCAGPWRAWDPYALLSGCLMAIVLDQGSTVATVLSWPGEPGSSLVNRAARLLGQQTSGISL